MSAWRNGILSASLRRKNEIVFSYCFLNFLTKINAKGMLSMSTKMASEP